MEEDFAVMGKKKKKYVAQAFALLHINSSIIQDLWNMNENVWKHEIFMGTVV